MSSVGNIIAEVISSRVRVKVLKLLVEKESLNISAIVRETKLNYRVIKDSLDYLVKRNIVHEIDLGRIKVYRLNYANPVARAIRDLFTS